MPRAGWLMSERSTYDKIRKDQGPNWTFSRSLHKIRTRLQLTQSQAADLCGCTEAFWISMERHEVGAQMPSLHTVKAICRGLKCTADELLGLI